jgi:hypothetical protein
MPFRRRLLLYLIGLGLGIGLSFLFLGDRLSNTGWMPAARVKQRLHSTLVRSNPAAEEALRTWPATLEEVRAAIPDARLDLKNSLRTRDSIYYALDATLKGRDARLVVVGLRDFDRDSTATLWSVEPRQP